jgi:spermidine synthase
MHPYLITFVVNAAILIFEITGSRLVAPHFGTSTEVWSSLIAVVVGGLSLGYYIGGIYADKGEVRKKLVLILTISGLLGLLIGSFDTIVLSLVSGIVSNASISIAFGGLVAIFILFFPVSLLLGSVYPFLAKLSITDIKRGGKDIGTLSAYGAVGSIVGALLAGLYLLPQFGSHNVMLGTGTILLLLAFASFRQAKVAVFLVVVATISIHSLPTIYANPDTILDIDTAHNRIIVAEHKDEVSNTLMRYISTDPFGTQCAMFVKDNTLLIDQLVFPYTRKIKETVLALSGDAKQLLFVGGCNYSLPQAMLISMPNANAHVVEIDKGMTAISQMFFGLTPLDRMKISHLDGRIFFNTNRNEYDVIILDAFGSASFIPFHLVTLEMFESVLESLAPNGIVIANIIGGLEEKNSEFVGSVFLTLEKIFNNVEVYKASNSDSLGIQNLMFVMSVNSNTLPLGDVTEIVRLLSRNSSSIVLTDDHAPVERLTRSQRKLKN